MIDHKIKSTMKKLHLIFTTALMLFFVITASTASAQVASGPSDITTAPPASAADAAKILCAGSTITLTGPQDVGGTDFAKYHWYKIDQSGTQQEVTAMTGKTYTETATASGYYNYKLITENAEGCTSPPSDVFKIFVLPPLTVSITSPNNTMCGIAANITQLAAVATPATGYVLNYQWTRNGAPIPGATSSTYNATGEVTPAVVSFGVTVTYALNSTCPATAAKDITITPPPTKPMITAN
jgi:hypothetical protein